MIFLQVPRTDDWRLATGDWRLATGDWQLATGDWQLATGDWPPATGDWHKNEKIFIQYKKDYFFNRVCYTYINKFKKKKFVKKKAFCFKKKL